MKLAGYIVNESCHVKGERLLKGQFLSPNFIIDRQWSTDLMQNLIASEKLLQLIACNMDESIDLMIRGARH